MAIEQWKAGPPEILAEYPGIARKEAPTVQEPAHGISPELAHPLRQEMTYAIREGATEELDRRLALPGLARIARIQSAVVSVAGRTVVPVPAPDDSAAEAVPPELSGSAGVCDGANPSATQ